jgi:predicted PhzF superfamily epimerase YddE/YHI9
LNKTKMEAKQLSKRGGHLWVEQKGDRIQMGGQCVFYMKGEFEI